MPEPRQTTFSTRQPGKALWTIFTIVFNATRLPFWILYLIPRALRQDPRWTLTKAIKVRVTRAFLQWMSDVEFHPATDLTPAKEGNRWTKLQPADPKYITGVAVCDSAIKPGACGGTWYPEPLGATTKPNKVVLHIHGGAFVMGSGRKQDLGFLAKTILDNATAAGVTHLFAVEYRLSSNPGGRFPAPLQDIIAAYAYLLFDRGLKAEDIIVSGDSAGGNLTLCLLRYLADHGKDLGIPNPSCAWLWSPWVDPGSSITGSGFAASVNEPKDFLNEQFGVWGAECYLPVKSTGVTMDSEYINFKKNGFKTDTPLFWDVCENEVLFEDVQASYSTFASYRGNKVDLKIEPLAVHDIMLLGNLMAFEQEAAEGVKKAASFYLTLL